MAKDVNEGAVTYSITVDGGKLAADAVNTIHPLRKEDRTFKRSVTNIQVEAASAAGCR